MRLDHAKKPFAVAMWDSSWLRRRYAGGGFESFDTALDELAERGYNAVRIDAFPHMIANKADGSNTDRFLDPPGISHQKFGFAQWGSPWTVYIYPKRDIVEFLQKCKKRNISVILSTWLKPAVEPRNEWMEGPEDLVRVWDETLHFLQSNGCLEPVIAVDVQNEFPYGACNMWLTHRMNSMQKGDAKKRRITFYRGYIHTVLKELKARWKDIPFSASSEFPFFDDDKDMDYGEYTWLDVHVWAQKIMEDASDELRQIAKFGDPDSLYFYEGGDYTSGARRTPGDIHFEECNRKIHEAWYHKRDLYAEWLEEKISFVAEIGKKFGIPYGSTEGWGAVCWAEHPMLSWDMIKDAGMIAAKLGRKYGYTFNCQSNFCEPQFLTLWRDVKYHQEITNIIKGE